MNKKTFENGSEWLRTDLHLHTISDSEFSYNGDKNYFVCDFINQLKNEDISVCAITNHNKFNCSEFKELRKNADKEGIYILPGVEFSVTDGSSGIHVVIIFDDEWIYNKENENYIQKFLDQAFTGIKNYSSSPYPNSNYNLQDLYKNLETFKRDFFINLAHVDDPNGLFAELKGRNLTALLDSEAYKEKVFALQKSRSSDNIKKLTFLIACVEGSDNKNIESIGNSNKVHGITQKTYIKLGAYNFEALKYALKDFHNRVSNEIPKIKNSYIKSIEINGGIFDGKKISFSPELNSLIGIRGSGKSALLEIIRWALGIQLQNSSTDSDYKKDLLTYALKSGGKVIIHFVNQHQKEYRIEKIYGQKENLYCVETGELLSCSIDSVFDNIIYYGQNDLSNKNRKFEDDLLFKLIKVDTQLQTQIENKKKEIKSVVFQLTTLDEELKQRFELEQEIKNIEQKLKYYKDNGLEGKLKIQTDFDSDESKILQMRKPLVEFNDAINNILLNYEISFTQKICGSESNSEIFEEINVVFKNAEDFRKKIKDTSEDFSKLINKYNSVILKLQEKKENLKNDFAEIKRSLNSETINPDIFLILKRNLETSNLKLQELNKKNDRKNELQALLNKQLNELNDLWQKNFLSMKDSAENINNSDGSIKITIEPKGKKQAFLAELKEIFRGTGIRDSTYQTISEKYEDFIEIYRNFNSLKSYLSESSYTDFVKRFNEKLSDLLVFEVEPKVSISYKGKKINSLSLGQRASALILFLLAQKNCNLLIIDQPEDDLDNQVIYEEVIKQIIQLKGKMQFIFATHNPNIPVLGDSEKILTFTQMENDVSVLQGSIDSPDLQNEIVNIMEGGQEAFKKRKVIYSSWRN